MHHSTFPGHQPGQIAGFDAHWVQPTLSPMELAKQAPMCDEDVWASPRVVVQHPQFEQLMAMIMEIIVAAGFCGSSLPERSAFIEAHNLYHHSGDAFDEHSRLINRDAISRTSSTKALEFHDYFPVDTPRWMLEFAKRAMRPRKTFVQDDDLIGRLVRVEIALKVFFVRIGHPQFVERHVPRGFLILEELARKQRG